MRRKRLAKERQAAIMARFSKAQAAFDGEGASSGGGDGGASVASAERLSGTVPQPVGRTAPRLIYELHRPLLAKESSGEGGASVGGAKALLAGEPGAGGGDSPGPHAKPAPARVCSVDASAMALRRAAHLVQQGRLGEARTLVREILSYTNETVQQVSTGHPHRERQTAHPSRLTKFDVAAVPHI